MDCGGVVEILEGEKGACGGEKGSVVCHLWHFSQGYGGGGGDGKERLKYQLDIFFTRTKARAGVLFTSTLGDSFLF